MFTKKVIPVIVINHAESAEKLGQTLVNAGLPIAEITLRTAAALPSIQIMANIPGLLVGAGTVLTVEQAQAAVAAGAKFLVSPGLHEDVIAYAKSVSIPIIPGIATPSEMARAISLGLDTVKFFPAEVIGGVPLLKALGSVYPHIKVMPTGGITPANIGGYLALPNVIACGGSWMVPEKSLAENDFDTIHRFVSDAATL